MQILDSRIGLVYNDINQTSDHPEEILLAGSGNHNGNNGDSHSHIHSYNKAVNKNSNQNNGENRLDD